MTYQRICSLLPSATEIICALGLADRLVAVSHECDYPPTLTTKAIATRSRVVKEGMTPLQIDIAVREQLLSDGTLYELDDVVLARLTPDLVVTQELCDVCAVSFPNVTRAAATLVTQPRVLSLNPHHFVDVFDNIRAVARATGTEARAEEVIAALLRRVGVVAARAAAIRNRPKVAFLEWLAPLYRAGHWTPEIIALAGGDDPVGRPGEPATTMTWDELIAAQPDVIVIAQCGYNLPKSLEVASRVGWPMDARDLPAVRNQQVWVVDGNAYFSRPGPRLVDSLEIMAAILHPGWFAPLAPEDSYAVFAPSF